MELHHLALGARDPDRVAAFYRDLLGLTEVQRHHHDDGTLRSVWLRLTDAAVLMVERLEADEADAPADPMRPGLFLVAVTVSDDERAALELRMEDAGHPIESRTQYTSYARDPEGNRVAFSTYAL